MKEYLSRVGALVLLLLSLTWLCQAPDWEPAIAFFLALIGYLGLDFWQMFQGLSEHDQKLIRRFHELFSEESGTITFLREHDIAAPFHSSKMTPVRTFDNTWNGIEFEFDDKHLEKAKVKLKEKVREYVSLFMVETYCDNQNVEIITMDFENSPEKIKIRDKMNYLSTEVYKKYERFIHVVRSKLKQAERRSR